MGYDGNASIRPSTVDRMRPALPKEKDAGYRYGEQDLLAIDTEARVRGEIISRAQNKLENERIGAEGLTPAAREAFRSLFGVEWSPQGKPDFHP